MLKCHIEGIHDSRLMQSKYILPSECIIMLRCESEVLLNDKKYYLINKTTFWVLFFFFFFTQGVKCHFSSWRSCLGELSLFGQGLTAKQGHHVRTVCLSQKLKLLQNGYTSLSRSLWSFKYISTSSVSCTCWKMNEWL